VQFALAVYPEALAFLRPSKGTPHYPVLGNDHELVEFIALGNLPASAPYDLDLLRKPGTTITGVGQYLSATGCR
jgi:hypothetical protein